MRSRFEGLLTRLLFYPSAHPSDPFSRKRGFNGNRPSSSGLTDLKGTLNYLATNAVLYIYIYVVVGCLSNTEHRPVTRNQRIQAYAHCLPRFDPSFIIIYRVRLICWYSVQLAQFSNIIFFRILQRICISFYFFCFFFF